VKQLISPVKRPLSASVIIPGSKSITNRALLLAALADGMSTLSDILISDDTRVFIEAIRSLGIVIEVNELAHSCVVIGGLGKFPQPEAILWCGEAGTAARFLLAACAASSGTYHFDAALQLRNRPLATLVKILCQQGAAILPATADKMPLTVVGAGGLAGGEIQVDSSATGQFLSALLMIAPFSQHTVILEAHHIVSHPYIEMTCAMMADFGVSVSKLAHTRFSIAVPQYYKARDYIVEPDLSTASYFFAAAAITAGEITIQPINRVFTQQGDIAFLSVLEKMGCEVNESKMGLTVRGPAVLHGIEVDMRDFSDTFMTLAAIAPFAVTPTLITHIGHTRHQESDRIAVMCAELAQLQVRVEEGADWLKIYPSQPKSGVIDAHQDHRIAMAFSLIGLRVPNIEIEGAECVAKTCPEFFKLWAALQV
jgi:3-phosphoshikimate 1-carboxyvinyltransferase